MDTPNEYTLTEDELGMLKPLVDNIESLQKEAQAIMRGISRLRNLQGNWYLSGDKMVQATNGNGAAPPEVKG